MEEAHPKVPDPVAHGGPFEPVHAPIPAPACENMPASSTGGEDCYLPSERGPAGSNHQHQHQRCQDKNNAENSGDARRTINAHLGGQSNEGMACIVPTAPVYNIDNGYYQGCGYSYRHHGCSTSSLSSSSSSSSTCAPRSSDEYLSSSPSSPSSHGDYGENMESRSSLTTMQSSLSPSLSSSSLSLDDSSSGESEESFPRASHQHAQQQKEAKHYDQKVEAMSRLPSPLCAFKKKSVATRHHKLNIPNAGQDTTDKSLLAMKPARSVNGGYHRQTRHTNTGSNGMLLFVGTDVMGIIMSYLDPQEALRTLTSPISKAWREAFTSQQELWKVLCLSRPFYATIPSNGESSDDEAFCSLPLNKSTGLGEQGVFGRYRLMYTSFVQCIMYLRRIKEDSMRGKLPTASTFGVGSFPDLNAGSSLKDFLAKARGLEKRAASVRARNDNITSSPIGIYDDGRPTELPNQKKRQREETLPVAKKPKFGKSIITTRLLGPSSDGQAGFVNLPRSCAIYSIVNWMVAFAEVEGIQTMCIEALPALLEDEQQRLTAQRVGLADVIVRSMVRFPESLDLHTEAFHTMVLLARPLGGKEGMLFDNAVGRAPHRPQAANALDGRLGNPSSSLGKLSSNQKDDNSLSGILTMLDSMRKFECEEKLTAHACWAMVNIALSPSQKLLLVQLGGIKAITNAMSNHPKSAEVQFRALFALINLVIPCKRTESTTEDRNEAQRSVKDILDESVDNVVSLVVTAMTNFCSSETVLNRACLVLHNLSQTQEYLSTLLWTPHCYQMLEWCVTNHSTDQVLRRSGGSVLHRLQLMLSADEMMRGRFIEFVRKDHVVPVLGSAVSAGPAIARIPSRR